MNFNKFKLYLGGIFVEDLNLNVNTEKQNEFEGAKKMNFMEKIIGVIFSPIETMKSIAAKPGILIPIILMVLIPVLSIIVRIPLYKEFMKEILTISLENSNQKLTPEQIDTMINIYSNPIMGVVSNTVTYLLMWLVLAALILAFVKIFKGKGSFKQFLSMTGYAMVIGFLSLILSTIVSFYTHSYMLDTSLANISTLILPDIKGSVQYGMIRGADIFSIWQYIVLGVGVVTIGKVGKAKTAVFMTLLFVVTLFLASSTYKLL